MLSIIVPYRNREDHLKKFIPHMKSFLNGTEVKINIIEQADDKPFNRGKLLNIGFNITQKDSSYFCFHDIDMLPTSKDCDYSFFKGVCKLSFYVSQFNFIPRPDTELGGVILIDKESFLHINGYSNNYWGWGVEDNDLALRCNIKKIPFGVRKGRYMSLAHKANGDTYGDAPSNETLKNRNYFDNIKKNTNNLFEDGLSTLEYKINDIIDCKNYNIYKVFL
jgi:predicted glycosyltransferase involved in capsule biosynthesis